MSLMLAIVYPGVFRQLVFNDHCRRRQLLAELDQAFVEFGLSFQPSPEERLAGRSVRVRNLCRIDSGNQGYLADEHVAIGERFKIVRASCRERVWKSVKIS